MIDKKPLFYDVVTMLYVWEDGQRTEDKTPPPPRTYDIFSKLCKNCGAPKYKQQCEYCKC